MKYKEELGKTGIETALGFFKGIERLTNKKRNKTTKRRNIILNDVNDLLFYFRKNTVRDPSEIQFVYQSPVLSLKHSAC